ncbi:MAG: 50S ribosomal protein L29 [Bordetella sp.]|nr:MAG: 50S ribosomal protein L29 [Bordetella sp.]
MNVSELRLKNTSDLKKELEILLKAQFGLRMRKNSQQITNNSQFSMIRKDIARIRTLLSEKIER